MDGMSDFEVHEQLVEAERLLGSISPETVHGNTAVNTAIRALRLLQFGLLSASEPDLICASDKKDGSR
jgi:hypothetical protein